MMRIIAVACAFLVVFTCVEQARGGLGKPLPRTPDLQNLKAAPAYRQAVEALAEKGFSEEQAESALRKLGPERLGALEKEAAQLEGGGDLVGFFLFVLLVALIIWLIIVVLEDAGRYRY
jgi:hypothetical protein